MIEVEVPFAPFIATRDGDSEANEGLSHYKSAIGISPDSTYILGLVRPSTLTTSMVHTTHNQTFQNFFQSMFVALHDPDPGNWRSTYVRLAPQRPEERFDYQLSHPDF